jgi:NAD+ kinase
MSSAFSPAFKTVAMIGRYSTPGVADSLMVLGRFLREKGCEVLIEADTARSSAVAEFPSADFAAIGKRANLAVVLGGDGSMLAAARGLAAADVPLVGVNQGRLGFMTDIAQGAMLEGMAALLGGEFSVESRILLRAEVIRDGKTVFQTLALNDVVVNKGAIGRLIEFLVHIDGQFVYDLRSDGLIVATPTGSTAYALSSNGPIVQPNVPGLVLVPISPHTLSNRPIAVSDDCAIDISIKRALDARLHFDGQPQFDLEEGDRVLVARAAERIRLVHPPGYSYYAMLREKLHWNENL